MKLFLKLFLLLSSLTLCLACSPTRGFHQVDIEKKRSISAHSVIDTATQKSVYKAKINVYDRYFSGLFLIKYMPNDQAYHVVLLSEVGLSLLDLQYKNNQFTVISCQDFLNKKILLETLQNDFSLLFLNFQHQRNIRLYQQKNDASVQVIKFRKNWKKFYYFCKNENEFQRIFRKSFFYGSVNVLIKTNQDFKIDEIDFKHKGIKLNMNLTRLNKNE